MASKKAKRKSQYEDIAVQSDAEEGRQEGEIENSKFTKIILGFVGALVVLFILCAGVWGVVKVIERIRENNEENKETTTTTSEDTTSTESSTDSTEGETTSTTESEGEQSGEGSTNGDGATTSESGDTTVWVANNYVSGEIQGSNYEVKRGDTLWEIAEARYGSGFDWVRIKEANTDIVKPLPNGEWALIIPGQILTLPE